MGADGAEQVGVLVALIGGLTQPRSSPRPLPYEAVLLADPGLILKPDLDWRPFGQVRQTRAEDVGEFFERRDDPLEVDPRPARDAVSLAIRARFGDRGQLGQLLRLQARHRAVRPMVEQTIRSRRVEAMNPVAQRLAVHAADLGRCAAVHPVRRRRQRQKPPVLIGVLCALGQPPKRRSRKIVPQSHR
jgi:hypothetical protein